MRTIAPRFAAGRSSAPEDARVLFAERVRLVGQEHELGRRADHLVERDARVARVAARGLLRRERRGAAQIGRERVATLAIGEDVLRAREIEHVAR